MMEFEIKDRVRLTCTNQIGTLLDKFQSVGGGRTMYYVKFEDGTDGYFREDDLIKISENKEIDLSKLNFEITLDNNIAIVRAKYNGKEISHNHGHIFHDGITGAVQAVSYAFRRMWEGLQGGDIENG